jgi:hypothetical protein
MKPKGGEDMTALDQHKVCLFGVRITDPPMNGFTTTAETRLEVCGTCRRVQLDMPMWCVHVLVHERAGLFWPQARIEFRDDMREWQGSVDLGEALGPRLVHVVRVSTRAAQQLGDYGRSKELTGDWVPWKSLSEGCCVLASVMVDRVMPEPVPAEGRSPGPKELEALREFKERGAKKS